MAVTGLATTVKRFSVRRLLGWPGTFPLSRYLQQELVRDSSAHLFLLCSVAIILSLLLGGGTRTGFLSDALLQLFTIPILIVSLARLLDQKAALSRSAVGALIFCTAVLLLPLSQLIPLPPLIWNHLPGRRLEIEVFELIGNPSHWMPISVAPDLTWQSVLSLIPPIAVFICTLLLDYRKRRLLTLVVLGFGLISVVVGLLQVAQGQNSPLRFFQITNPNEAVGFFANRNHFAALLYVLMLFAAAWAIQSISAIESWWDPRTYQTAKIVPVMAGLTILVVLVSAQAMARSRAGIGLTMLGMFGAFALSYVDRRSRPNKRGTANKLIAIALALAVLFSLQFALYRIMERFKSDLLGDGRIPVAQNSLTAASSFLPFGAGMGTFVPVYGIYEKPKDTLSDRYINHAHDDVLELFLEAGVFGIVLMVGFAVGWGYLSAKLWRRRAREGEQTDATLARAASLAVGLLIVHSFVDYPLRTQAMMSILAFSCALLIDPPREVRWETAQSGGPMVTEVPKTPPVASAVNEINVPRPRQFQAPQINNWPDEWLDPNSR